MFAIIEISGEQFKIDQSTKKLRVPYMSGAEEGQSVTIGKVLLAQANDGKVTANGKANIKATVAGHIRGEKILVFHKKRRKGYRKTNGHTPRFTEINIEQFSL